jgi:protein phosphatase inhibitor 2
MPNRELSEKQITQMNTEANAGGHRRTSSNQRNSIGRRLSSQPDTNGDSTQHVDGEQRLKWDEANLYLNEGQMGGKMKIDEPKTPFAKNYDPTEDEEEIETINAEDLAVDELEMKPRARKSSGSRARENDIPDIDLGEPELVPNKIRRESDGERRVHVDEEMEDDGGHGEQDTANMTHEEREKHQKFEEMRKKHYEMKNIKSLLGSVSISSGPHAPLLTLL